MDRPRSPLKRARSTRRTGRRAGGRARGPGRPRVRPGRASMPNMSSAGSPGRTRTPRRPAQTRRGGWPRARPPSSDVRRTAAAQAAALLLPRTSDRSHRRDREILPDPGHALLRRPPVAGGSKATPPAPRRRASPASSRRSRGASCRPRPSPTPGRASGRRGYPSGSSTWGWRSSRCPRPRHAR